MIQSKRLTFVPATPGLCRAELIGREAVGRALVARAFTESSVVAVRARTYGTLLPSRGVLEKAGVALCGQDASFGLLRFECRRRVALAG